MTADDVTAEIVVEGGYSGPNRRTVLRLGWHRRDPLAVRVHLTAEPDHPALPRGRWTMLRDLLRYGCHHPAGDGDVRVRPEQGGIAIELWRAGRASRVVVPAVTVHGFLAATEALVPVGEERSDAEVDAFIDRLLSASG